MGSQADALNAVFDDAVLGTLPKAGGLTYVPVAEVIARLNDVLGTGGWGYVVIGTFRDSQNPDWVIAQVRLRAEVDGEVAERDGFGGYDTSNRGMDTADGYKSAVSEALKKAAQALGVGLHLSRNEEAIAIAAMAQAPRVDPIALTKFKNAMKDESVPEEVKERVKAKARELKVDWKNMTQEHYDILVDLSLGSSVQSSLAVGSDDEEVKQG